MKKQKKNMIPLQDLNLTSRFLYDEVMESSEIHREALSIIFGKEIPPLNQTESEKELRISPTIRSIRMDVISIDEEDTVYNSEMNPERKTDLAKRSRYYQALLDTNLLEPGIPNYNLLNQSYIILITCFDLFGLGKYQYTFEPKCKEVPDLKLEDGATRIFLNTRGKNDGEVSKELVDFLHYLEDTTDERAAASGSERIQRIHERVRKVKLNEEMGVKYMQAWEEKYYERQDGREEGKYLTLIAMIQKKLQKGKSLERIADELEEDISVIEPLYDLILANPDADEEDILDLFADEEDDN